MEGMKFAFMTEDDLIALPGEQLWDHAHRLILLGFRELISGLSLAVLSKAADLAHATGSYVSAFEMNKASLRRLLQTRALLMTTVKWPKDGTGLLLAAGDSKCAAVQDCSGAFVDFVKSWQPLMDSVAKTLTLGLREFDRKVKVVNSVVELGSLLQSQPVSSEVSKFLVVFTGRVIEWYQQDVRIMRNQFVHNERIALALPDSSGTRTLIEIKKLEHHETSHVLDLDRFLNWTYAEFLLFASSFARKSSTVRRTA